MPILQGWPGGITSTEVQPVEDEVFQKQTWQQVEGYVTFYAGEFAW